MATNNAWNSSLPAEVAKGGTGAVTLTANGVLVGAGTSAVSGITAGTTGQLLVGVTSSNPAFGSSASADFTFTSATAGATRTLTVSNTDNSNTSSNAADVLSVGGASAGDPYTQYAIGTARSFAIGPDNSDSDKLKINTTNAATATPSSGTNVWTMTTNGERTLPSQPSFSAYLSSSQNNVTGDGTVYTVICDTELFDRGSNYNNSTGTFTAPVTGLYFFTTCFSVQDLSTAGSNAVLCSIVATGQSFRTGQCNFTATTQNVWTYSVGTLVSLTAADTVTFTALAANGTKNVDIIAGTAPYLTFVSGYLVA